MPCKCGCGTLMREFEPTVEEQKKYKQFAMEEFFVMSKL